MDQVDKHIPIQQLIDKFFLEFDSIHDPQRSTDWLDTKLHELATAHIQFIEDPDNTDHIRREILYTFNDFDRLKTYLVRLFASAQAEGVTRKPPPVEWTRTPVSMESTRIESLRSTHEIHNVSSRS